MTVDPQDYCRQSGVDEGVTSTSVAFGHQNVIISTGQEEMSCREIRASEDRDVAVLTGVRVGPGEGAKGNEEGQRERGNRCVGS